ALLVEELLASGGEILRQILGGGLLFVDDLGDRSVGAFVDRAGDAVLRQREENGGGATHGSDVRQLRVAADKVAGLDGELHLGGCLGKVIEDLGAVGELDELRIQQLGCLLFPVVVQDVRFPRGKVGRVCSFDVDNLEDRVALAGGGALRGCALRGAKGGGQEGGGVGEAGDDAITPDEVGGRDVEVVCLRGLV